MKCRYCDDTLSIRVADLGSAPPSNAYLKPADLGSPERWFPLRVLVCGRCWLVQTEDFARFDELFDDNYAYFSSYSTSWLAHADSYVANVQARFELNDSSHVIEVAANDGYLLQFVASRNIPCTGIEPTASTAAAARARGIPIVQKFFGENLAHELCAQGKQADLIVANNVLAHVPNISDFVTGFRVLLKSRGVATFEFPHLVRLIDGNQFDTIYHEHFSYLSLTALRSIFATSGLKIFDVQELTTHGGSLRIFAQREDTGRFACSQAVVDLLRREEIAGVATREYYATFQARAESIKNEFIRFLLDARRRGARVVAYGAAAKGNTLLNFAGVRSDLINFVADRNPAKQGNYLPGSRIPIVDEERIRDQRPDFVVVLPWNLKSEITRQLGYISSWGGRFVTAIPMLEVTE